MFLKVLSRSKLPRNVLTSSRSFLIHRPLLTSTVNQTDLIKKWRTQFETDNVPEIDTSLDNFIAHVIKSNKVSGLSKRSDICMTPEQVEKFEKLCHARIARMPIQYIIGEWDFRDLKLIMQPPVFIPRPETEELVELILQQQIDLTKPIRFLEIGCGSGAISLSLLSALPNAVAEAADQSSMACLLTMKNAINLKLSDRIKIIQSKIGDRMKPEEFNSNYDFIVSNPPYIPSTDLMHLDPEIRLYEDLRALDGGDDGLGLIKILIQLASRSLKTKGALWLEVDPQHPELISHYLGTHSYLNLKFVASYQDLFQNDRFVEIQKL